MKFSIDDALHQELRTYLEGTFPNEGGGFLIGEWSADCRVVTELRFVENVFETEEQYHRYLMEAEMFDRVDDYADAKGLTLLGYFHSHPDSPAIPSEFDRVNAMVNFIYLIVSVREGKAAESRVWLLAEDYSRFNELAFE